LNTATIDCEDLSLAIEELRRRGFRLDVIYPAEDPKSAVLSRGTESVRLVAPGAPSLPNVLPPFRAEFVLTRAGGGQQSDGRAGMLYRDLIPGRLGGRYVASHISIPEGGPVSDWVHYHRIALQMIIVRRGWVRVVYEDQGEAFVMEAGDIVLQPPFIRHRVLESSPGLEVIEISAPALHETFADHEMKLPGVRSPERLFGDQRFLRHRASQGSWTPFSGGEAQETAMNEATGGLAEARLVRAGAAGTIEFGAHTGELVFGFVLEGKGRLASEEIGAGDAFVIPPDEGWRLVDGSPDFQLLHVTTARLDASADCFL
jgi:uncharacterized protein YjlB